MQLGSKIFAVIAVIAALGLAVGYLPGTTPTEAKAIRSAQRNATAYELPPQKLEKAVALSRIGRRLNTSREVWSVAQLLLLLRFGWVARMSQAARRVSGSRWVQGALFAFLVLLGVFVLDLPLGIYGHHTSLLFGISVQGWGSWLADRGKTFAIDWLVISLMAVTASLTMSKSPTRWWFWYWIPAALCIVAGVFITPYVIDPLFNKFVPLAQSDPTLVLRLEQVVAKSGIPIPPERMFLMGASAKSTTLNAYVTGFGASKRVVVWDTTVAKSTPDEIAFIFAHEMGHYALGHVVLGVSLSCVALLPFFWLGHHGTRLLLRRYGAAWRISSQQDWAALVVLAMVLMAISALSDPLQNGVSRRIEHNADVYGQEAVHGIVSDPQAVGLASFRVLGEDSLDDPTPHPIFEWWFGTHPAIRFRAGFAQAYDPWAPEEHPKYFVK